MSGYRGASQPLTFPCPDSIPWDGEVTGEGGGGVCVCVFVMAFVFLDVSGLAAYREERELPLCSFPSAEKRLHFS